MTRFMAFLLIIAFFSAIGSPQALAERNRFVWGWWPMNWQDVEFQPYLGDQRINQPAAWNADQWTPEDWVKAEGSAEKIMYDFYAAGIVTDQYYNYEGLILNTEEGIPVLEVGEPFMKLSGLDRIRVLKFVDYAFGITRKEPDSMFYVMHVDYDEPLGLHNSQGFQQN